MTYYVKQLPNEPIILAIVSDPFNFEHFAHDFAPLFAEISQAFEQIDGLAGLIWDVRKLTINFSDLVNGLYSQGQGLHGSMSDPQAINAVVGSDIMVRLALESFKQKQYGEINIPMFDNYDAALANVRKRLTTAHAAKPTA